MVKLLAKLLNITQKKKVIKGQKVENFYIQSWMWNLIILTKINQIGEQGSNYETHFYFDCKYL
jgi:hypothetical protein